ncbi:MAG TPA: 50S ribosomal protein L11 methyltransferase [Rhizomicrobium sp.]|nr:50S ribosomal protein L11 methyltransferase [Rhizomicrobium sp.]
MVDTSIFIKVTTQLMAPPLVPEIRLHLATEIVPLWRKTEEELEKEGVPPPYWAFAWAGGQALARYLLDHGAEAGSTLDFGSGSGLVAIAAAKAGAADVLAADIDPFAAAAIALNARENGISLDITTDDVIGREGGWDVILVGDMCYERPLADSLLAWLDKCARAGATILMGDPGRTYFPKAGVEMLATYRVQTTRELEDREIRETSVYRYRGA